MAVRLTARAIMTIAALSSNHYSQKKKNVCYSYHEAVHKAAMPVLRVASKESVRDNVLNLDRCVASKKKPSRSRRRMVDLH